MLPEKGSPDDDDLTPREAKLVSNFYLKTFPAMANGATKNCWMPVDEWPDKLFDFALRELPDGLVSVAAAATSGSTNSASSEQAAIAKYVASD